MLSREKNVQILIALLKEFSIKKVVVSPGNTNTSFVGSIQNDPFFEVYSCVDERSACYMACGMAQISGEPVIISCTGATASRNYYPGLTEAYYRKLPIIALTSTQQYSRIGNLTAQTVDRTSIPTDSVSASYQLPVIKDKEDFFDCTLKINRGLNIATGQEPRPIHFDLPTTFEIPFDVKELPPVRKIQVVKDELVSLPAKKRIAFFVGSHRLFTETETKALDQFCGSHDAIVLCDHTSGYYGRYRVNASLLFAQADADLNPYQPDILIHIGEVSGDYYTMCVKPESVWRIDETGSIQDLFRRLTHVFQCSLLDFLDRYSSRDLHKKHYHKMVTSKIDQLYCEIPELPFGNIWVAQQARDKLPTESVVHLGILNSLRSWNFFEFKNDVTSFSNVGGFGIDGAMSTAVGSSIVSPDKTHFLILGDLAFFYDINVLGNRHIGSNLKIIIINNGEGTEFKTHGHHATYFGADTSKYISAKGHNGQKSQLLLRQFVEQLGFNYFSAQNKAEFMTLQDPFFNMTKQKAILEIFTESRDEHNALEIMKKLDVDRSLQLKSSVKSMARNVPGAKIIGKIMK